MRSENLVVSVPFFAMPGRLRGKNDFIIIKHHEKEALQAWKS
jgi:hypothetical protein